MRTRAASEHLLIKQLKLLPVVWDAGLPSSPVLLPGNASLQPSLPLSVQQSKDGTLTSPGKHVELQFPASGTDDRDLGVYFRHGLMWYLLLALPTYICSMEGDAIKANEKLPLQNKIVLHCLHRVGNISHNLGSFNEIVDTFKQTNKIKQLSRLQKLL